MTQRTPRSSAEIDKVIGQRVRLRRQMLGMSQQKLAEALKVSFQQVQKYENGVNRVSAGRLHEMSKLLGVPLNYFFATASGLGEEAQDSLQPNLDPESAALLDSFNQITDPKVRASILRFVRELSGRL